MIDIGLTHIALPVSNVERSIEFYSTYAAMQVIHRRIDAEEGISVVLLSDHTRPFAIVLLESEEVHPVLSPLAYLGSWLPKSVGSPNLVKKIYFFQRSNKAFRSCKFSNKVIDSIAFLCIHQPCQNYCDYSLITFKK